MNMRLRRNSASTVVILVMSFCSPIAAHQSPHDTAALLTLDRGDQSQAQTAKLAEPVSFRPTADLLRWIPLIAKTPEPHTAADLERIAAGMAYLSIIMHRWNTAHTLQAIKMQLTIDFHQFGVAKGLVLPTLSLIEAAHVSKLPKFTQMLVPTLAHFNPVLAKQVGAKLKISAAFPKDVLSNPLGNLVGTDDHLYGAGGLNPFDGHSALNSSFTNTLGFSEKLPIFDVSALILGPGSFISETKAKNPQNIQGPQAIHGVMTGANGFDLGECGTCIVNTVGTAAAAKGTTDWLAEKVPNKYLKGGLYAAGIVAAYLMGDVDTEKCSAACGGSDQAPEKPSQGVASQASDVASTISELDSKQKEIDKQAIAAQAEKSEAEKKGDQQAVKAADEKIKALSQQQEEANRQRKELEEEKKQLDDLGTSLKNDREDASGKAMPVSDPDRPMPGPLGPSVRVLRESTLLRREAHPEASGNLKIGATLTGKDLILRSRLIALKQKGFAPPQP